MEPILLQMNDILKEWKQEYDLFVSISTVFSVEQGFLCFGTFPLCKMSDDFEMTNAEFDAESIQFSLSRNRSIVITIDWPEDQPPVVTSVAFVYVLTDRGLFKPDSL